MAKSGLSYEDIFSLPSPSGFEHRLRSFYTDYFKDKASATGIDVMGNASVVAEGGVVSQKLMLISHLDEVGFLVSGIEDDGFIRIKVLGSIDRSLIQGKVVDILASSGTIRGITGKKPIHYMSSSEEGQVGPIEEMYVDIGSRSRKDSESLVSLGDPAVWSTDVVRLKNNVVAARGVDNRVSVYIMMRVMENVLSARKKAAEDRVTLSKHYIYGVLSSMEEVDSSSSAYVAASNIRPSACIVLETEECSDYPDAEGSGISIFGGPVIDKGVLINRALSNYIANTAAALRIPYQVVVSESSTATDVDDVRKAAGGIPCALVSIPIRYMHSPVSLFDTKVVEKTIKLLTHVCENIHTGVSSFLPK